MREVPQPTFERDIKKLTRAYKQALKDVQSELNALFLTDFQRAQIIATEKQITAILSDIKKYGDEWASVAMTSAASEGIASTIYSLGLADTIEDARKIVSFNQTNRRLVDAAISDTQADLLAVTQNVNRQATLAIRKATAEAMRNKLATGVNATDNLAKEIRDKIVSATDVAIIDARGRRWKVETYADMLARTKMMEAHKEASINEALSEGSLYATISRHGATDACRKYEGKVVKLHPEADGDFPYISDLPRNEIFHVNCKHVITPLRRLDRLSDELKELNGITDAPTEKRDLNEKAIAEFDRLTQTKTPFSTKKTELRKYMKELLENSGIDGVVNIKRLNGSYGQVTFTQGGRSNVIRVKSFAINADHLNHYTIEQTLFHEFYHARYNGLRRGKMSIETWLDYEETATELASLFMTKHKGYTLPEIPAYSDILVRNLPLLKQTKEFRGLTNVFDFGENYLKYRFDPEHMTADWTFLAEQVEDLRKTFDFDAYARKHYEQYVRDNIDDISLGLAVHHGIKDVSLIKRLIIGYADGERTQGRQFYDAVLVAMMRIGVK